MPPTDKSGGHELTCPQCGFRSGLVASWVTVETPSAGLPCKAYSFAYGGGATCEQRWACPECGDVTDTERCPKGRQNETLAALATPSSERASDPVLHEIEEALWALHSYESNRGDAGRSYSEAEITKMVSAIRALAPASASRPPLEPRTWNTAIERCATLADEEWVGENSLSGSKLARRIADRIRDLKILSKNEVVARSEGRDA